MATNPDYQHIAIRFPPKILRALQARRKALGVRSLAAVVVLAIEQHRASSLPTDLRITQDQSQPRTDLWLPRHLVGELREIAGDKVKLSNLIVAHVALVAKARPVANPAVPPAPAPSPVRLRLPPIPKPSRQRRLPRRIVRRLARAERQSHP